MNGARPDCAGSRPSERENPGPDNMTLEAVRAGSSATGPAGVTPEIMSVIEMAASRFMGTKVRIVSVRLLPALPVSSSSWARRGREISQASHNLVQRRVDPAAQRHDR